MMLRSATIAALCVALCACILPADVAAVGVAKTGVDGAYEIYARYCKPAD
jgi:hypothetical protein